MEITLTYYHDGSFLLTVKEDLSYCFFPPPTRHVCLQVGSLANSPLSHPVTLTTLPPRLGPTASSHPSTRLVQRTCVFPPPTRHVCLGDRSRASSLLSRRVTMPVHAPIWGRSPRGVNPKNSSPQRAFFFHDDLACLPRTRVPSELLLSLAQRPCRDCLLAVVRSLRGTHRPGSSVQQGSFFPPTTRPDYLIGGSLASFIPLALLSLLLTFKGGHSY